MLPDKIRRMRYMAIDYGTKRIGVAVSDRTMQIAGDSQTILCDGQAIDKIVKLCAEEEVTNIIIGLPLKRDCTEGEMCQVIRKFGDALDCLFEYGSVRIEYRDESRTTVASTDVLIEANISRKKRKKSVDALAAKIMLQRFLDEMNARFGKI